MAWRVAESLIQLRAEVNGRWPNRDKASDGTIGDADHQSRNSDHNPWVPPPNGGVVTAMDIDASGGVAQNIWEQVLKTKDQRVKFMIYNKQIVSSQTYPWVVRKYGGSNPHTSHIHTSVRYDNGLYDKDYAWGISGSIGDPGTTDSDQYQEYAKQAQAGSRNLGLGSAGDDVKYVQEVIGVRADGYYGTTTREAVIAWQRVNGLKADGIVGTESWNLLLDTVDAFMATLTDQERKILLDFAKRAVRSGTSGHGMADAILSDHRARASAEFTPEHYDDLVVLLSGIDEMKSSPHGLATAIVALIREARARGWEVDTDKYRENKEYPPVINE